MKFVSSFTGRRVSFEIQYQRKIVLALLLTGLSSSCARVGNNDTLPACLVSPPGLVDWWTGDAANSSSVSAFSGGKSGASQNVSSVSTQSTKTVGNGLSFGGHNSSVNVPNDSSLEFTDKISIGAWVKSSNPQAISGQSILSKGHRIDGLSNYTSMNGSTVGFVGLTTGIASDGRYVYWSPCGGGSTSIGRYDRQGGFTSTSSWETMNISSLTGAMCGPAFFDGRYVIVYGSTSGQRIKYDTTLPFTSISSWSSFSVSFLLGGGPTLVSVHDGRYFYFSTSSGVGVARYDSQAGGSYETASSWTTNLQGTSSGVTSLGYDGRYIYLVQNKLPTIYRLDTTDFASAASWSTVDTTPMTGYNDLGFYGAQFDGRYLYMNTQNNTALTVGLMAQYDTTQSFTASSSWKFLNVTSITGLSGHTRMSARGSAYDGRYLYVTPWSTVATDAPFIRFDTLLPFDNASSWSAFKTGIGGGNWNLGGLFDGRYVYSGVFQSAPNQIYRFDTAGSSMSFDLRANNSSYDGQAVSTFLGPSFQINTASGYYTATAPTPISPDSWHYILGVYDGSTIKMYVDGSLVASSPASGSMVITSDDLKIGTLESSKTSFNGSLNDIQIYNTALSASDVQSIYASGLCK